MTFPSADLDGARPHHRGDAPAARDDGGMADQPASGGEDAGGVRHPVHVRRATSPRGRGSPAGPRRQRARPPRARSRSRRSRRPATRPGRWPAQPDRPARADEDERRASQVAAPSCAQPLRREQGTSGSSAISTAIRSAARGTALADPDLEHPEPALLDGELDVAQVGVVALEHRGVFGAARLRPRAGGRPGSPSARSGGCPPRRPRPGRRTSRRRTAPARRSPGCG